MKMIYAHYNNIIFCALTRRLFRGAVSMIVINHTLRVGVLVP